MGDRRRLSRARSARGGRERRARLLVEALPKRAEGVGAELVFAATNLSSRPPVARKKRARAHAAGDEVRTVIAGYHWFTDWGRDTMISSKG